MVWIVPEGDASRLDFHAISDSTIVSGLIYLALRVYSGRSAAEILATPPDYIEQDRTGQASVADPQQRPGRAAGVHPGNRPQRLKKKSRRACARRLDPMRNDLTQNTVVVVFEQVVVLPATHTLWV